MNMKAIYIKPEMEIVQLNTDELLEWGRLGKYSQTDRWTSNDGFFEEENKDGKDSFFDD